MLGRDIRTLQFDIPQFDKILFPRMKQVYLVDGLTSIWVLRFRGDAASGFADTAICICKGHDGLPHALLVLFVRPHWQGTSYHRRRIPRGSDNAASPFSRLCISLSRLLQIIKRDWKSEGIRSGGGAKEERGGSINGAKTYPIGYIHEVRLS